MRIAVATSSFHLGLIYRRRSGATGSPRAVPGRATTGLGLIAEDAVQRLAKPRAATLFREYPRAQLPWWIVPHVLVVATGELGDPMTVIVLMKTDDRLLHVVSVRVVSRRL